MYSLILKTFKRFPFGNHGSSFRRPLFLRLFMSFHVRSHVATLREPFPTFIAFIGPFPSVPPDVNLESAWPHKLNEAVGASERSFTGMAPHMIRQVALCSKSLVAAIESTMKRLFSRVNPYMGFKVTSLSKALLTSFYWTNKWLFSSLIPDK